MHFVFFGMLKAGFDFIQEMEILEEKEKQKRFEEMEIKAIERACKKTTRFLYADGSVNVEAARQYLKLMEKENRRKVQTISFEVIK
jgi:hypothetical protein